MDPRWALIVDRPCMRSVIAIERDLKVLKACREESVGKVQATNKNAQTDRHRLRWRNEGERKGQFQV